jgi:hypothetical protein
MAEARRKPIIRQTYYYGSKKVQVGNLKGGTKVGFIAVEARAAAALGLKLNLPTTIPGTTYTVEGGIIFDNHTTKKGKVSTPVSAKVGSKKVTVYYKKTSTNTVKLKGTAAKAVTSELQSVIIGIPAWGDVGTTRKWLKDSKAESFSFGGGDPYPVKTSTKEDAK